MTFLRDDTQELKARNALFLWLFFIIVNVAINGTIPFLLGVDMHAWTTSRTKEILLPLIIYGGIFLTIPMILTKGIEVFKKPLFVIPLVAALISIALWHVFRGIGTVVIAVLVYLHLKFDLSELGFRSHGWKGDLIAILLPGILTILLRLFQPATISFAPAKALLAGLDRLFFNPASSIENLFYFGFLTERLSAKTGKWLTPLIIASMYTLHEMTNPEYWYQAMNFIFVFFGIAIFTILYLWRKSIPVVWLSDGLRWIAGSLI